MGIEIPKIEVRYENLSVEGDVYVGSRALPTLFNVALNTIEVILSNYIVFVCVGVWLFFFFLGNL